MSNTNRPNPCNANNATTAQLNKTRTMTRQAHYDLFAIDGRWLGTGFGLSAHDAANLAGWFYPVAYAKEVGTWSPAAVAQLKLERSR